jgi:hypothetical protein
MSSLFLLLLFSTLLPIHGQDKSTEECITDCVIKLEAKLDNIDVCSLPIPCFWADVTCDLLRNPCSDDVICAILVPQTRSQLTCGWTPDVATSSATSLTILPTGNNEFYHNTYSISRTSMSIPFTIPSIIV